MRRSDADRLAHLIDVGADQLAHVGDLVHERNPRRQDGVRRVLAELGAGRVHHHDRRAGPRERARTARASSRRRASSPSLDADDHAIRLHEVLDRRALLEELGVADDAERLRRFAARWPRAPFRAVPTGTVLLSTTTVYLFIARPTSRATASTCCRSADPSSPCGVPTAMKTIVDARTAAGRSVREAQALLVRVAPHHFFEARLVDRHLARP